MALAPRSPSPSLGVAGTKRINRNLFAQANWFRVEHIIIPAHTSIKRLLVKVNNETK